LGEGVGVPESSRIFFDLIRIPAIKAVDFTEPIFYDPVRKKPLSLCQIYSHIAQLYEGNLSYFGRKITKVDAYNDSVSPITLSFPYDHICQELQDIAIPKPSVHYREEKLIENLFTKKLEPLIEGFFTQILKADLADFSEQLASCKKSALYYFREVIRVYRHEVEATTTTLSKP